MIDVMIVGVEKAGTSALLNDIGKHREVAVPGKFKGTATKGYDTEFSYFLPDSNFKRTYREYFEDEFGDIPAPNYVVVAKNVGICYETKAAERLKEHNEDVKVIVLLRNPVSRAYSSFWYQKYRGSEDCAVFREAINKEVNIGDVDRHRSYVSKGLYFRQILELERIFGKKNMLVLLHERYISERDAVLKEVFSFVGLDYTDIGEKQISNPAKMARSPFLAKIMYKDSFIKNVVRRVLGETYRKKIVSFVKKLNSSEKSYPPINEEDESYLVNYYRDDVFKLSESFHDVEKWWPVFFAKNSKT